MNEESNELFSSVYGTKEHWDDVYKKDLAHYKKYDDLGDIWFGEDSVDRIITWIESCDEITKQSSIIDLGCGNGFTLLELSAEGYKCLYGIDYSNSGVNLAKEAAEKNECEIAYEQGDLVSFEGDDLLKRQYDVCHDKGTYDAINLCADNPLERRARYIKNVHTLLEDNGFFIITSCNWTEDEMESHFKQYFEKLFVIPTPSFLFGGIFANPESSVVFKKKSSID